MADFWGEQGWGEGGWGGDAVHPNPSTETAVGPGELDVIFAQHPCSVLGTGNNPDLLVYTREAV